MQKEGPHRPDLQKEEINVIECDEEGDLGQCDLPGTYAGLRPVIPVWNTNSLKQESECGIIYQYLEFDPLHILCIWVHNSRITVS